jgi:hypothetical protein
MRAVDHPGPERTVAVIVILVAVGALTVALLKDAERVKQTAASVAEQGVQAFDRLYGYRAGASAKLPTVPTPAASEALAVRVAHALAVAPAPLNAEEIGQVLDPNGAVVALPDIEAALRTYPMFVPGPHGWQLGAW